MSNFQPLDPNIIIDPFNTPSLTGVDARTGVFLDADPNNSSVLVQTNSTTALYIDKFQNMGINTSSPSAQLDVNSSSGSCIQLTYNGSSTNKANISVSSDGKLILLAGGSEVNVDTTSNFNVKSHNGTNSGLLLGNSLVLSTADQLNFNVVTPGTAAVSKALVLNSSGNISGINSLSASSLLGTIDTPDQPNIRTLDIVDIVGHTGTAGLSLGGVLVSSTAEKLNYTDTTPGTAMPSKALVVDANRSIMNINSLVASQLTGTIQTAAQPNITSVGTLTGLDINGTLSGLRDLSINTTETGRTLVLNDVSGNCLRMYYDAAISAANYSDLLVDGSGNLILTASGGNVDITSHDGVGQGLKLGSVLVTATADQLNYLQGTTPGFVTPGKAVISDSNRNIDNVNSLTAISLTGTLLTASQPNIASVNALNIVTHNGTTTGLKLNGVLVTSTADELNFVDTTPGAAEAMKALVLSETLDIEGIHSLVADELTGTLLTASQPNITSVGTLSSISTSGDLTIGTTTIQENEIGVLDGVVPGTASGGKALVVDMNRNISNVNSLVASELTGTIQTGAQPNITSVTTLDITGADGALNGLKLGGVLLTSTAEELNYVDTVPGIAAANKALILDLNKNISNINSLTAVDLTGTLQTASQPNITSVGTLSTLSVAGDVKVGETTLSESEVAVLDGVVPGTVSASKALVVDADKNISTINSLSAISVVASELTGTIQTGAQPNITSVTTLDITGANGIDAGLRLGGVLLTATAEEINSIFGEGGEGTFQNLKVNDTLTLANADGVSKGLVLGSTLVTANATELNYIDGSTPGLVVASKAVVVDENKDITSFRNLTAMNLTGTLQTVAQPNITSVGTLDSLSVAGDVTIGDTILSESEVAVLDGVMPGVADAGKAVVLDSNKSITGLESVSLSELVVSDGIVFGPSTITEEEIAVIDDVTPGTASALKALILDSSKNISGINSLSASSLTGTLQTAAQPNITSVGTLTSITTSGDLTLGTTSISESEIGVLDAVVPGVVNPSKAVVVDMNKDISSFRNLTAVNLTGTIQTAAQPHISSVDVLDVTQHDGETLGLQLGGSLLTATATELNYIDGSVPGVVVPGKAVVVDGNKDISSFRRVTSVALTSTSGSLTMGATEIDESEIAVIDEVVPGVASASKALVLDTFKDISGIRSLTSESFTSTAGSLTMGSTIINESEIAVLDNVVPGTASASKALVLDASRDISGIRSLTSESLTSTVGSLTMGSTIINESEIAVLDDVVPGVVSASKGVVVDENKDITSFRNLTAVNLTGTLQTVAQPNITSVGKLDSLSTVGDISTDSDVIIAGTTVTGENAGWLSGATPGTAQPTTALVVDEFKDIDGIRNLTGVNLIGTTLTGTIQTASQPNITSVRTLDITDHDGETQGLKLGGVLLTTTAEQINSIFGEGGEGTFNNLTVNDTLTLANADGMTKGLVIGSTLVTATGEELNYVDTIPGQARPSKALVFDENIDIENINSLTALNLHGTIQTASQPNITSVSTLDITQHDGETQGLKLGGVLLTATATQINSIFGEGGEGTFTNLTVNDTLTLANADGTSKGLVLGETLVTTSGVELNYLDGSIPGTASAGKAVVLDSLSSISGINSLTASTLTGTLQTAAQPNITSVGTLESLSVAGDVTIGDTILSENEVAVLDEVIPGTVDASKVVVVDANKDISSFRNLTALNLIATDVTGTLQTPAQPNITSVGELTSLSVAGDVNVGGNLNVGGTFISEAEIVALDAAEPGNATPNKAMITDENNSIANINSLSATFLTGTLQTTAQPNITSVGELTSLSVAGDVNVGGNLNVGGTFISEAEIVALDAAEPGNATPNKAMITDENNSIANINSLSAVSLTGTIQTAAQPNIASVTALDVTSHDGATVGLKLGGTLVTSSATELNYVDTTAGQAQASKALVLDANKDISGINSVSMNSLSSVSGTITSDIDSISSSTGAFTVAGGAGISKSIYVGSDAFVSGALVVQNSTNLAGTVSVTNEDESTSEVTGSITTAGGIGVGKSIFVAGNSTVVGNVSIIGSSTQAGLSVITNTTESTAPTNGSLVTNGGVGITKSLNVGQNTSIGGSFSVNGLSQLTGDVSVLSTTQSTSVTSGSIVTSGGVGIAKNLHVGENLLIDGWVDIIGTLNQSGLLMVSNLTDSTSTVTGSIVTAGGVGISKNLNVGGLTKISNATESTDASTGAFVVTGGSGIGGDLNVGGKMHVEGDISSSGNMAIEGSVTSSKIAFTHDPTTESVFQISAMSEYVLNESGAGYQWNSGSTGLDDGLELMKLDSTELVVNTSEHITDVTDSTSVSTGALRVAGGVGIMKNLNVGADTSLSGMLAVTGNSTMTGIVSVTNTTESTSVDTGSVVTAGGIGIAKSLYVGADASVNGDLLITGSSELTGSLFVSNVTDSSSLSTGSLVTAGGVGIAKSLNVGTDASVGGSFDVTGTTSLVGDVSVSSETESTSISTGAVVVSGGVGISKSLHVGLDTSVGGDFDVTGSTSLTGSVLIADDTQSTNSTNGSFVTAGGVGIAMNLNVSGTATIANATPSTSATTGALVVSGGIGVSSDINVGGDVGIAGDLNLIGDFNLSGDLNTTNVSLVPDAASPFSTLPLTTITRMDSALAINENAGIGYINDSASVVAIPDFLTTSSLVYYSSNSTSSTFSVLAMKGSALSTYNTSYSGYGIRINQLYVNSFSGKIWLAGSFFNTTNSVAVVLSGDIVNGIDILYVVGSESTSLTTVECRRIAVGTDDNDVVVVQFNGTTSDLYKMNIAASPSFSLVLSGTFVSVAWLNGLGKFVATRNATSSIYCSTDSTASIWMDATTPTAIAPNTVYFNTTINLAVAVGSNFIWYSTNGTTWTEGSYPALAGSNTFNAVVNSPVSGLIAIYSNIMNSVAQLYYSIDAINWIAITLDGPTFGHSVPLTTSVAFSPSNFAFALSNIDNVDTIQRIGPITSASMIYGVGVSSGYLKSESAIGYEWYVNSTPTEVGDEVMRLTAEGLVVNPIVDIENTTNSVSPNTGSLTTAGGAGITKDLNVGMNVSVGGDMIVAGSVQQNGTFEVGNNTDSTSTTTGSIITAGGVGIAKALHVGTGTTVGGALSVGGMSSLIGSVSVSSATESSSLTTGSITTQGGVGIAKSLMVGINASIGGNLMIDGMTTHVGALNILNDTNSVSTSTGSIITAGGVGISKELNVGTSAKIGGPFDVIGASSFQGFVSIDNATDSTSSTNGSLKVVGGVGVAKSLFVGNNVSVNGMLSVSGTSNISGDAVFASITDSVSTSTGAVTMAGGVGIAKSLYVGIGASIAGTVSIGGITTLSDVSDSFSVTTGSITTAGGVGIAKSLYVGTGIYGTIETAAQPNISSVTVLDVTGANGTNAGLSLGGALVTSSAVELNYLDGSVPGTANPSTALVFDVNRSISGINSLSALELFGTVRTASQPFITSVSTLDITAHDGLEAGLKLGGVLLTVSANQINSLFAGTSEATFTNATVTGNLILSGADGASAGLIIGSTLVTASGTELNYVDTTPGIAEPLKALVLNSDRNVSGIGSLSAMSLTGTLQTSFQPNVTSVNTLDIVGHNGTTSGLSLGGVLITSTANEINYLDTTQGVAEASKALVLDANKEITGISALTADMLIGTIQTADQPLITSLGDLVSLNVIGDITIGPEGTTILSESDLVKIDAITNGVASANKALVLDASKNISGIHSLSSEIVSIGAPLNSDLPLEVGFKEYIFTGSYAFSNDQNAHGLVEAGMGTMANYSLRTDGRILCTGEIQITSDRRMKENIIELTPALSKKFIMSTTPVKFNWKSGDGIVDYGYIAQDVMKAGFTDLVTVTPHPGVEGSVDEDGFINPQDAKFVFSPGKIIPLLALNQREVFVELKEKDEKIADLESRIAKLEEMIHKMMN